MYWHSFLLKKNWIVYKLPNITNYAVILLKTYFVLTKYFFFTKSDFDQNDPASRKKKSFTIFTPFLYHFLKNTDFFSTIILELCHIGVNIFYSCWS